MTIPIARATWDSARWDACTADFNEWRGACIDIFSRAEHAVTETLTALAGAALVGAKAPYMTGGRFEALAKALAGRDQWARPLAALVAFQTHHPLRTMLCHGVAKLVIDRHDRWSAIINVVEVRGGHAQHRLVELREPELLERYAALRRDGQVLGSLLGQVRKGQASGHAPPQS